MKEIKLNFVDELHARNEVEQFVNKQLELLSLHLGRIINAFYDLNWGEESYDAGNDYAPDVQFTIPFNTGMSTGGPLARVFEFMFYTDSSDIFKLYVNEWVDNRDVPIAQVTLKFSDWRAHNP